VIGAYIYVEVEPNDTMATVKQMIEDREGYPAEQQRLIFPGRGLLDDTRTISDYGIQSQSILHLFLQLSPPLSLQILLLVTCHAHRIVDVDEGSDPRDGIIVDEGGYQILKIERRADTTVSQLKAGIRTRLGLDVSAFERDLCDTLTFTSASAANHDDDATLSHLGVKDGDQLVYQLARFSE
jgi:hypothetical protein